MYIREDCYFGFFIEILKYFVDLVGTWYLVVGSRYVFFFSVSITCGATHAGRVLFDT